MKLMMFSKHLQTMSVPEAGRVIKNLGFAGVDLTVRPGGHVSPETVRTALPEAVQALADQGLAVPLLTTGITAAADPYTVDLLETAARVGRPEIKLGYWRYRGCGTIHETVTEIARKLDGLEALAQRIGVRLNIHNHSADFMSALAPLVWHLIKDRDPAALGAYVDPGHMVAEGGDAGWKMGLDLLGERINLVAVKDMAWHTVEAPGLGKPRWITKLVPLNEGFVPWPEVFACLRQAGFDGWVSVHSEYQGNHSWRDLSVPELIDQTRQDLQYLRWAMEQAAG